jgi:hypothetical protein
MQRFVRFICRFFCLSLTVRRIAGLEWVFLEAKASGRPSIINISCGGDGTSQAVNDAVLSVSFLFLRIRQSRQHINCFIGYECRNPCCGQSGMVLL